MSLPKEKNLTEIFKALSHPLRQEIIIIIASYQKIGYTALQEELNRTFSKKTVKVGSIYHHIGLLGDLIVQNENPKTWSLSDQGWYAYNLLTSKDGRNQFLMKGDLQRRGFLSLVWNILAPPSIFLFAKKSLPLFIGWLIVFFFIFSYITSQAGLVLVFVFFSDLNIGHDLVLSSISLLLSWLTFSTIVLLVSKFLLKNRKINLQSTITVTIFQGIALLPLVIFPSLIYFKIISFNQKHIPLITATILQLWVILLTARSTSVQFFIRMDKAGLISLFSVYIMVILGLVLGF